MSHSTPGCYAVTMRLTLDPSRLLLISLGGRLNQHQREVIDYLAEENRALREQTGSKRLRIQEADAVETFEGEIQKLIVELKISHMDFFHHSLLKIPPNYAIGATFQPHRADGNNYWMFQDLHEIGPAHLSGMHAGDLRLEVVGKPVEPPDQPTVRMGGSCDIIIEKLTGERVSQPLGIPRPKSKWHPIIRPRLVSSFKPEPDIGLLKAAGFPGQVGIDVAREIDDAISNLRECTRLIVDLRGNPGGGAGGLRLMSYLTPDKLPRTSRGSGRYGRR